MHHTGTYRADIDGLRAIAVASVVINHAVPAWLPGGFVGVDIFFVISGFLITGIISSEIAQGRFSLVRFYKRRILRIIPALSLVVACCLLFGFVYFGTGEFANLGKHAAAAMAFAANFSFWSETGYFDTASAFKPLLHLWSLGVEEQFYLFWPAIVWIVLRVQRLLGSALLLVLLAASLLLSAYGARESASWSFYLLPARLWELGLGSALALLSPFARIRNGYVWPNVCAVLGLAFIVAALLMFDERTPFPGVFAIIPVLGSALLLSAKTSVVNKVLSSPPLVWVGLISYPLYLWHWPILSFMRNLSNEPLELPLILAGLCAAVLAAIGTFFVVERPIRFGLARRWPIGTPVALLGIAALLGASGAGVYAAAGLPSRLPEFWREFETHPYLFGREQRVSTCFLQELEPVDGFSQNCTNQKATASGRGGTIFLWGDSHAAALYPGLEDFGHREGYSIEQINRARCPPLMNFSLPGYDACGFSNRFVLAEIERNPPDTVIIAAAWSIYNLTAEAGQASRLWIDLTSTIDQLKTLGVPQIVIVDTVPIWRGPLPSIVRNSLRAGVQLPPERIPLPKGGLDSTVSEIIHAVTSQTGTVYFSPRDQLCNEEGCLVRIGESASALTTWDDAHLSPAASRFVVDRMAAILIQPSIANEIY